MSDEQTNGDSALRHGQRMTELAAEQAEKVRTADISRGVVIVHTGDGKGKSTAGFGVAMRAVGHGQAVGLVQFIKGTWKTGERAALQRFPEIEHVVSGQGFTWITKDREQDIASAETGLAAASEMVLSGTRDVVILDEIHVALSYGYLDPQKVVELLETRPEHVSVVLTGRNAPPEVIDAADTVTEHRMVKHAFRSGIRARKGIEF